jgi:thymidylate synthase ThyX
MERHMAEQCQVDEALHAAASDAVDEMVRIIQQIITDFGKMKPNVVHEMQKYHRDVWNKINDFQQNYILNVARQNLEWGRREGLYRTEFDLETAARFYIAGAMAIFDDRYFPKPPYNYDFLFKEYITNYLHSIVSDKGLILLQEKLAAPAKPLSIL